MPMASQTTSSSNPAGNVAVDVRLISSSPPKETAIIATSSATEEDLVKDYIVYPVDGHKVDSIACLLASFPPSAKIVPHISVSGWGMMYWEATLSKAQSQEVSLHKQVRTIDIRSLFRHISSS